MTATSDGTTDDLAGDPEVERIEADLAQTREQLGVTVATLAERLNVKARAKHKAQDAKQRAARDVDALKARGTDLAAKAKDSVTTTDGKVKTPVPVALVIAVVAVVAFAVWRRKQ